MTCLSLLEEMEVWLAFLGGPFHCSSQRQRGCDVFQGDGGRYMMVFARNSHSALLWGWNLPGVGSLKTAATWSERDMAGHAWSRLPYLFM